jgi:hypothetical protein
MIGADQWFRPFFVYFKGKMEIGVEIKANGGGGNWCLTIFLS